MTTIKPYFNEGLNTARKIEISHESLARLRRWEVLLENQDNEYGGTLDPQDPAELKINDVSMLKGYIDDVLPSVDDPFAVYRNLLNVVGRDYGQDLANLFLTKEYRDENYDDIFDDALSTAGSEITYTSPSTGSILDYSFKRQFLLNGFQDLAKLVDADFYVDDLKALQLFLLSAASSSGVTLKAVAGASDNNVLSLKQIGEKVGFDLKNYIHLEAGDVNDHWTEMNASDWSNMGVPTETVTDDTSIFLAGKASIKTTIATAAAGRYHQLELSFPRYSYTSLDLSEPEQEGSYLVRHDLGSGGTWKWRPGLKDGKDNIIYYKDVANTDSIPQNKWREITFPLGDELDIGTDDKQWYWSAYIDPPFDWADIVSIRFHSISAASNNNRSFWTDGIKLPIPAISISEDATSQSTYRKRMIPLTRNDIKSQIQLDDLAASELAHRKDPTQKLNVVASFQSGCKYAGQTIVVNAPSSGISNITYRILGLHHVAAPGEDLLRGHDAITEFDLVKHETASVQPTDPLRFRLTNNPFWTTLQRLEGRIRNLERG
jgi:hypothetical protein